MGISHVLECAEPWRVAQDADVKCGEAAAEGEQAAQ